MNDLRYSRDKRARRRDSLLNPRSSVVGAIVAVLACIYFVGRTAVVDASGPIAPLVLLALLCGLIAYLVRAVTTYFLLGQ